MAYIFVSHSSKDDQFALRLSEDLQALGHHVFLDEWVIKVGDAISQKVNKGLGDADYIVVVITAQGTQSGWVEREWQTRYGDEIRTGRVIILPALLETCELPPLLRDKRYADFRKNYNVGLVHLAGALNPMLPSLGTSDLGNTQTDEDVTEILSSLHDPNVRLSRCLTDALALARKISNGELAILCRNELHGWKTSERQLPREQIPGYRQIEAFIAPFGELNLQFFGFQGDIGRVFTYMRAHSDEFFPYSMIVPYSVAYLEARPTLPDR